MDSEQFQRVRALFHAACELPAADRARFLAEACGEPRLRREVEALLEADASRQGPLSTPEGLGERVLGWSRGAAAELPARIGRYRVLERIGAGGMGEILKAEQEAPRRIVAIKLIRAGLATPTLLRRFELEAHVLGRLQHPCIAQIFEAGVEQLAAADGRTVERPYFVMEYVPGAPLTTFARAHGLSVRQRLELVARLCDGVQHAHQRGVIHRDLKPANILVIAEPMSPAAGLDGTAGALPPCQPKILDFGIARAMDDDNSWVTLEAGVGQVLGTLAYMSPEQVAASPGGVDTRTDVYALGVILYELLTGNLPHDVAQRPLPEAARIIADTDAHRLSTLDRTLRGDLDVIVATALQRDRERRYASPAELAQDLRAYLAGRPIAARRESSWYLLQQGVRRYRAALLASAAFLVLSLASAVTLGRLYQEAERRGAAALRAQAEAQLAAERSRRDATRALQTSHFVTRMIQWADPRLHQGRTVTVRQALDDAAARVAAELHASPEARAGLEATIGSTYRALGELDVAERLLLSATELYRQAGPDFQVDLGDTLNTLGAVYADRGAWDRALACFSEAEAVLRAAPGDTGARLAAPLANRARLLLRRMEIDQAEPLLLEARQLLSSSPDPVVDDEGLLAQALLDMATFWHMRGDAARAESLARDGLDWARARFGGQHPMIAAALNNLAAILRRAGRREEAEAYQREALDVMRAISGEDSPETAHAHFGLGALLHELGRLDEAAEHYTAALCWREERLPAGHPDLGVASAALGGVLSDAGRAVEAEPLLRNALEIRRAAGDVAGVANTESLLGQCLLRQARLAEAEPLLLAGYEGLLAKYGPEHPLTRVAGERVARYYGRIGRPAEAPAECSPATTAPNPAATSPTAR